jgi:hypothetical protein
MKLKDFVAETLKEIVDGVADAQYHWSQKGGSVIPGGLEYSDKAGPGALYDVPSGRPVQVIEFDVAVTTEEGTGTEGGIGVFVGAVALGSKGKSDASMTTVNRIKFSVPVLLPPTKH